MNSEGLMDYCFKLCQKEYTVHSIPMCIMVCLDNYPTQRSNRRYPNQSDQYYNNSCVSSSNRRKNRNKSRWYWSLCNKYGHTNDRCKRRSQGTNNEEYPSPKRYKRDQYTRSRQWTSEELEYKIDPDFGA